MADKAADLRSRRKWLRTPDALILATADLHPEVSFIVTGDRDRWVEIQDKAAPRTLTMFACYDPDADIAWLPTRRVR